MGLCCKNLFSISLPTPFPQLWRSLNARKGLFLLSGPCVIESETLCRDIAKTLKKVCADLGIHYVFKASYDKANRTSGASFRGPGIQKGLEILQGIREDLDIPVVTDIHNEEQAEVAGKIVDIIQIPAFLSRQTDLIRTAVETGAIVNIKKGQFLSPGEMARVIQKAREFGAKKLLITERGTTFGYQNLVVDMRSIPLLKKEGFPVVIDATHSVQLPGAGGDKSSGQGELAPLIAYSAVAAGATGVFIETHPDPLSALSDGPNMIPLKSMPKVLKKLLRIAQAVQL